MLLVRVQLPDRPGSLGTVATAMGLAGADISAIEIVEKGEGFVVDDFMLTMPPGSLVDLLVSECNDLDGVQVLWVSRYPDSWGIEGDIELLNAMSMEPSRSSQVLTERAPVVFRSQWAAMLDADSGQLLHGSAQAPDEMPRDRDWLGGLDTLHTVVLPAGWLPLWPETVVAVVPVRSRCLVVARQGGPDFLDSELRRLHHIASLA
ncbi:amino acid-binding protein [Luteococcus peritonei]|uniref:Amino acid-binding protein n=1 Tax=Luteococcus peritonei TaxID=88874 RepID=A0ABW4RYJ2_9ACTN